MKRPKFGEQRLVRPDVTALARLHYRLFGVADPAHYLHHRLLRRILLPAVVAPPRSILDAGCGRADHSIFLARCFPSAHVVGVDINPTLIELNKDSALRLGLTNIEFVVGDLASLEFPEAFDVVVSVDVLEHIVEQRQALQNLQSALRPGGLCFYHVPTVRETPVPFSRWLGEFHEWGEREHLAEDVSADRFVDQVVGSGLGVLRSERTFGYYTGELATSLFSLPYRNTPANVAAQLLLALPGRVLALADGLSRSQPRFAVAVLGHKQ